MGNIPLITRAVCAVRDAQLPLGSETFGAIGVRDQWHYLKDMELKKHRAGVRQRPSHRRKPVSRMALRYWIPAFAGTTRFFPLFSQLLVVECKYMMSVA